MSSERFQDLSTFRLPADFRGRNPFLVQFWWLVQSTLFACSPQFMYGWRRFLLRLFGCKVGRKVLIRPTVRVQFPWKVTIGDWSWIGDNVMLYSLGPITIGEHAVVSQKSYLCTGSHRPDRKSFDIFAEPIVIEDEAWLAADVFVAPGVRIGRGAFVSARSSVFRDMPSGMVCVGSPCRPIRKRSTCPGE